MCADVKYSIWFLISLTLIYLYLINYKQKSFKNEKESINCLSICFIYKSWLVMKNEWMTLKMERNTIYFCGFFKIFTEFKTMIGKYIFQTKVLKNENIFRYLNSTQYVINCGKHSHWYHLIESTLNYKRPAHLLSKFSLLDDNRQTLQL